MVAWRLDPSPLNSTRLLSNHSGCIDVSPQGNGTLVQFGCLVDFAPHLPEHLVELLVRFGLMEDVRLEWLGEARREPKPPPSQTWLGEAASAFGTGWPSERLRLGL